MKESNWEECMHEGSAISITEDLKKADSLRKTAKGRMNYCNLNCVLNSNCI